MNVKELQVDKLRVLIYPDRDAMGYSAAREVAEALRDLLTKKDEVNVIFAAAPSQNEFLASLRKAEGICWEHVNAFHMDEYVGLPVGSPASFTGFLNEHVFDHLPFKAVYRLNGAAECLEEECKRYTQLLAAHPVDMVFMGAGENGHIAFNDPPVADFHDSAVVKVVELDETCRLQQVHDKCFDEFSDVPTHAFSLTVPILMGADRLFCMVPGEMKANAIKQMLGGQITTACPASILRTHDNATLYVDRDSAQKYLESL